ncbi:MAG: hypothetical protein OK441_04245 [Thaumarchaeota archaeon]|nr:hypothetical protein [Nitrososphaerota archaeon]
MNRLVRAYLAAGVAFNLSVYVILLSVWFEATLNGSVNGQFAVAIDTNAFGESYIELALLFLFLPVAAWVFTNGLRRLLRTDDVA